MLLKVTSATFGQRTDTDTDLTGTLWLCWIPAFLFPVCVYIVKKMTHDNPCLVFTPCRCTKPVHSMGPYGSNPGGLEPLVRAVAKPCAWALSALDTGSESLSWRAIDWDFWSVTPLEQNLLFGRSVLDIGWWQAEEDWSFLSYRNLFSRVGGNFNSEAVAGIQFCKF